MTLPTPVLPVVYSCSGCSSAAQLANHVALRLDRKGLARIEADLQAEAVCA